VNLAFWSVWRILGVWSAWFLFLVLAAAVSLGAALWRARQATGSVDRDFRSDFAVAITGFGLRAGAALLLLPPLLLTVVWLWQRAGSRGAPT
jgi:hypothetical protein